MSVPDMSREVAIGLYGAVDWASFGRVGLLSAEAVASLAGGEAGPLSVVLADGAGARDYAAALASVVGDVSDVAAQQYALTRIEDILVADDAGPLAARVAWFCGGDGVLDATPFMRSLEHASDAYSARVAASVLATLLTVREEAPTEAFANWCVEQLGNSRSEGTSSSVKAAVPALTILLRVQRARRAFAARGGVGAATKLLKRPGAAGDGAQSLYELVFVLWTLSFAADALPDFLRNATIEALCEVAGAAPREKVVRVAIATLRNLAEARPADDDGDDGGDRLAAPGAAARMIKCGLTKTLRTLRERPWADADVAADVDALHKILLANYRDLSTLERYCAEVRSGDLAWGLVHSERFWRENARAAEADDFAIIKALVALLGAPAADPTVVAVACYDVGEFVRFYPNGKAVIKHLGAKDRIMALIDHGDPEIQRHALQCVSKILVTNWEFVSAN